MVERLSAMLSIGYLADRLARAVGWSPKARLVLISAVEGPAAEIFEGLTGTVKSVEGTVMIVEPDPSVHAERMAGSQLRLTARHRGWTPFSLFLRPIAVVVEAVPSDGRPSQVAIGTVAIMRKYGQGMRG